MTKRLSSLISTDLTQLRTFILVWSTKIIAKSCAAAGAISSSAPGSSAAAEYGIQRRYHPFFAAARQRGGEQKRRQLRHLPRKSQTGSRWLSHRAMVLRPDFPSAAAQPRALALPSIRPLDLLGACGRLASSAASP